MILCELMISSGSPSSKDNLSNSQTHNDRDEISGLKCPTQNNNVNACTRRVRKNRHHCQHESVGYGRLEHVDDASRKVVGQDERRDDSSSSDIQSGSIRQRRRFQLVAGGIVVPNCVLCGSVKCATKRLQPFVVVIVAGVSLERPIAFQPTADTVDQSLQYSEEKEGN